MEDVMTFMRRGAKLCPFLLLAALAIACGSGTGSSIDGTMSEAAGAQLAIGPATLVQAEGNTGTTAYVYAVTRSGDTASATSANWAVTGSGANAATAPDFAGGTLPGGVVSFAAGEATQTVTVNVVGDTVVEPDEGFTVTLSNPGANTTITTATAAGTITNDDAASESTGNAVLAVSPAGGLTASTFTNSAFSITNASAAGSGRTIQSVSIDIETAALPYLVFDPAGLAGDTAAKEFTANSGATLVGLAGSTLTNGSNSQGYTTLTINFADFGAGETFAFSIDVDPSSIRGVLDPGPQQTGSVSGLELVGSQVSVTFDDGTARGDLFAIDLNDNGVVDSLGGARAIIGTSVPVAPVLAIQDIAGSTGTVSEASQVAMIAGGPANTSVRVLVVEGGAFTQGVTDPLAQQLGPFDANTALTVVQYNGVSDSSGNASIPISLTRTERLASAGTVGLNYVTAAFQGAAFGTGLVSPAVVLAYVPPSTGVETDGAGLPLPARDQQVEQD